MARHDAERLPVCSHTVRPARPPRALYERLKLVATLVSAAPPAHGNTSRLLWRNPKGEVVSLEFGDRLIVGREGACNLVLPNPRVSRRHCELRFLHGSAWVTDLDSTNGTKLNGRRVSVPTLLRDGDLIEVGGEMLVYLG